MDMPKPTDQHKKLEALAGKWVGEEKMPPSSWGPGGISTGKFTARMDLEGFFLVQDYQQEKDGKVVYRGHGIIGWDDAKKSYSWYWVDSMGNVPPAVMWGKWEGDTLLFPYEGPQGKSRHIFKLLPDGRHEFRIDTLGEGNNWKPMVEGTYRRS